MANPFMKLLFFDTFTHERGEDLNIDLVKFSGHPVVVREIRIVPNNTNVPLEPNVLSQGYTSPSSFSLEIFVNNLSRSAACTFEKLCSFDYRAEKEIRIVPGQPIATDGLLIRGLYHVITLAIYGEPTPEEPSPSPYMAAARTPSGANITSNISPTQTAPRTLIMPLGQPTPWPAPPPILELPHGVAPFNPLIPPPPTMASTTTVFSPIPTIPPRQNLLFNVAQPPTIDIDFSRPPPLLTNAAEQTPQQCSPSKTEISSSSSSRKIKKEKDFSHPSYEGKPIETIGTVKPVVSSVPAFVQQQQHSSYSATSANFDNNKILEEGGSWKFVGGGDDEDAEDAEINFSVVVVKKFNKRKKKQQIIVECGDDDNEEKYNLENISEEEFELDDAADVDYAELQEDLLKDARFNAYRFELTPLIHFHPPYLSQFEIERNEASLKYVDDDETPNTVKELLNAVDEFAEIRNEKWVCFVESLLPNLVPSLVYVQEKLKNYDALSTLIKWSMDGLNFKLALKQEKAAFIIRHLKAGLKLAASLVEFEKNIAEKFIEMELHHKLLDLLTTEHMSLPLKLQIVKTLDASLFFPVGYRAFVDQVSAENSTPYQRLTNFVVSEKTSSRLLVAVKALLKKIHFFRTLTSFSTLVLNSTKDVEPSTSQRNSSSMSDAALDDDEVNEIGDALHEILSTYKNAKKILVQPPYYIPAAVVFEWPKSTEDPYPSIFQYFIEENFLESLLLLMTCRRTNEETRLMTTICQVVHELLSSNGGLLFLTSQSDVTAELLRFLLQHNEHESHEEETIFLQQLGLDVANHLQALHLIDELMHYQNSGVVQLEVDNPGVLFTLQSFYVLTFDQQQSQSTDNRGRRAVIRVLSYENNLNSILPFVELSNDEEWDNKIKKSACAGYATELLLLVLRLSDSVELLKTFGDKLLAINCEDAGSKIVDVKQWTEILRKLPSFSYDSVEYLCEKIKSIVQHDGVTPKIPKSLITALRILKYLVVAPSDENSDVIELKYKYSLMQMLCCDTLTTLVQIIDKLAESHMVNWQQGISLNSHQGSLFYACVLPTLSLIRSSVSYLACCRGGEYQDVTSITPLLKMYAVCCTMLPASGIVAESSLVQKEIVAALLAYTQPDLVDRLHDLSSDDSFEILTKSLWTRAVNEVLKFTTEAPFNFVAGLSVLSELLPLPLPVQTKESLSVDETAAIETKRRLWSAHLAPLAPQLQEIIRDFTQTTHPNLQHSLRKVCVQLSDLSSHIAAIVAKAILFVVLENGEAIETCTDKDLMDFLPVRHVRLPATAGLAFSLNLVSYLSAHGPFKVVLMDLLRQKPESNDQQDGGGVFGSLLTHFLDIFNYISSERTHQLCQEHIVSILQSFCDEDIGLLSSEKSMTYEQISCSTPEPQQLRDICIALLKHIGCRHQPYATVLPSLRIFVMLCEHDYGLYNIKKSMEIERRSLLSMFQRLLFEFSGHSSDCLSTLSTFIELMKLLQMRPDELKSDIRKFSVDVRFIRDVLDWKYGDDEAADNDDNPLKKLYRLLESSAKEDDALTSLFTNVERLVAVLSDPTNVESEEFVEPILPSPLDVRAQFQQRQLWTTSADDDDDRLTAHYWFPIYTLESEDGDVDKVECDLETIRLQYFPSFDISEEVKRKFLAKRPDDSTDTTRKKTGPGFIDTSGGQKKRFIAPLRGRIRSNVWNQPRVLSNRPNDAFRNRPPNTSRPPSMHVDDFIIAEAQAPPPMLEIDKSPGGPPAKIPKDSSSMHGRMTDRTSMKPPRSRPTSPPPHNSRNVGRPYLKPVMSSARSFSKGGGHAARSSTHDRPTGSNNNNNKRPGRKSRHSNNRSSSHRKTPK